jgi:hypothetical protein
MMLSGSPTESNALALLDGHPGNAILPNGVLQIANREIGVPGFQTQVPKTTLSI